MLLEFDCGTPTAGDFLEDLKDYMSAEKIAPYARVIYKVALSGSDAVNEGRTQIIINGIKYSDHTTTSTGEVLLANEMTETDIFVPADTEINIKSHTAPDADMHMALCIIADAQYKMLKQLGELD